MPRPRVTFSRNGSTSSGRSGPPKETSSTASYGSSTVGMGRSTSSAGVILAHRGGWSWLRGWAPTGRCSPTRRPGPSAPPGFVARLPLSMTGLGIVLLVSLTSGSFGRAGLVAAVEHPDRSRGRTAVGSGDRPGRPGPGAGAAAMINSGSLGAAGHQRAAGLRRCAVTLARRGRGRGRASPRRAPRVRARWSLRLRDSPLLQTAFAVEAVLDEVVFIVGPVAGHLPGHGDPPRARGVRAQR